jgi:hypothetical protein
MYADDPLVLQAEIITVEEEHDQTTTITTSYVSDTTIGNREMSVLDVLMIPGSNIHTTHTLDITYCSESINASCISKWKEFRNAVSYHERTDKLYDFVRIFVSEYESNSYVGHVLALNKYV